MIQSKSQLNRTKNDQIHVFVYLFEYNILIYVWPYACLLDVTFITFLVVKLTILQFFINIIKDYFIIISNLYNNEYISL